MGVVADSALQAGGQVIGVIPPLWLIVNWRIPI
jgi:predicted Rossmann-fold nucleotide-binding protein